MQQAMVQSGLAAPGIRDQALHSAIQGVASASQAPRDGKRSLHPVAGTHVPLLLLGSPPTCHLLGTTPAPPSSPRLLQGRAPNT